MGSSGGDFTAIETAMLKCETVEGLKRAIDNSSRRLLESAREEWERRFGGKDPRDACVSVRITGLDPAAQMQGVPASGFVQTTQQSHDSVSQSLGCRDSRNDSRLEITDLL